MNKKTLAKCLAVISAVIMAGCSSSNTPAETAEDTASAEVTTVSETSAETTAEETTAEETTTEETTTEETTSVETTTEETTAETEAEAPSDMDSEFFDYKLIEDYPASEIPEDMQEKAVKFLKNSDYYAKSQEKIALYECDTDLVKYVDNVEITPLFLNGWQEDFDGDGSEEAFLLVNMPMTYNDSISTERSFLIFSDKNGEMTILDDMTGLYPVVLLDYGEFKHISFGGYGIYGADDHTFLYGVSGGKAKELYGMRGGFVKFGCLLSTYGWQGVGSTMYFDTQKQQYISITGEKVSIEEFRALDTDNITADFLPENDDDIPPSPVRRFGSNYYVLTLGIMDSGTVFVYEDGKLRAADDIALRNNCDGCNGPDDSIENIDLEKALENMKEVQ